MLVEKLDIMEGINPKEVITIQILAEQIMGERPTFVEIGSWKGHSASIIGAVARNKGGHLYCVDHWRGNEGTRNCDKARENDIYKIFIHNMEALHLLDYITPLVMESLEACEKFGDKSIDFLFIDADHRYTPFISDLKAWYPKMKIGGIICGHDCDIKYTEADDDVRARIDAHRELDFDRTYHCGIVRGLYDFFNDDYARTDDIRIWMKRVGNGG